MFRLRRVRLGHLNRRLKSHYTIDDKPPFFAAVPLALQHVFAAFSGIVAVPLVVGGAIGLPVEESTRLVHYTGKF